MLDRFAAARAAGFDWVEIQFPYQFDLADLIAAKTEARTEVVMINLPPGDLAAGDVGLTAVAGREAEYRVAVELACDYAAGLGVSKINSLSGRASTPSRQEALDVAIHNLRHAADTFAKMEIDVMVEPVSPAVVPGFFLTDLRSACELVAAVDRPNIGILFDLFHMQQTEASLVAAVKQAGAAIGHVQFADVPGRHEPGTGEVDFDAAFAALREIGFTGGVGAEYNATGPTEESLAWMQRFPGWAEEPA
ncbi:hydroxypyruvate isomerase family protein [Candidatus Rhodobacter oscarellae]|nr:TIM barrel protein [Candidatus Rhodobacter lobularis]